MCSSVKLVFDKGQEYPMHNVPEISCLQSGIFGRVSVSFMCNGVIPLLLFSRFAPGRVRTTVNLQGIYPSYMMMELAPL